MNRLLQFDRAAQPETLTLIGRELLPDGAVEIAGHGCLELTAVQQYQAALVREVGGADGIHQRALRRILTQLHPRATVPARQGFQGAQGQALTVEVGLSVQVQPFVGARHAGFLRAPLSLRGQPVRQAPAAAKSGQLIHCGALQQALGGQRRQGRVGIQHALHIGVWRWVQRTVTLLQQRSFEAINGIAKVLAQLGGANVQ